jgi:hypothetical protein
LIFNQHRSQQENGEQYLGASEKYKKNSGASLEHLEQL